MSIMVVIGRFEDYKSIADALELEEVGEEELIWKCHVLFLDSKTRVYSTVKDYADRYGAHVALIDGCYAARGAYKARVRFYWSPVFLA